MGEKIVEEQERSFKQGRLIPTGRDVVFEVASQMNLEYGLELEAEKEYSVYNNQVPSNYDISYCRGTLKKDYDKVFECELGFMLDLTTLYPFPIEQVCELIHLTPPQLTRKFRGKKWPFSELKKMQEIWRNERTPPEQLFLVQKRISKIFSEPFFIKLKKLSFPPDFTLISLPGENNYALSLRHADTFAPLLLRADIEKVKKWKEADRKSWEKLKSYMSENQISFDVLKTKNEETENQNQESEEERQENDSEEKRGRKGQKKRPRIESESESEQN